MRSGPLAYGPGCGAGRPRPGPAVRWDGAPRKGGWPFWPATWL